MSKATAAIDAIATTGAQFLRGPAVGTVVGTGSMTVGIGAVSPTVVASVAVGGAAAPGVAAGSAVDGAVGPVALADSGGRGAAGSEDSAGRSVAPGSPLGPTRCPHSAQKRASVELVAPQLLQVMLALGLFNRR